MMRPMPIVGKAFPKLIFDFQATRSCMSIRASAPTMMPFQSNAQRAKAPIGVAKYHQGILAKSALFARVETY